MLQQAFHLLSMTYRTILTEQPTYIAYTVKTRYRSPQKLTADRETVRNNFVHHLTVLDNTAICYQVLQSCRSHPPVRITSAGVT